MKRAIDESYGTKGENVVKMNYAAVDRGSEYVEVEIPKEWNNATGRFVHANTTVLLPNGSAMWPTSLILRMEILFL